LQVFLEKIEVKEKYKQVLTKVVLLQRVFNTLGSIITFRCQYVILKDYKSEHDTSSIYKLVLLHLHATKIRASIINCLEQKLRL
jgi:hypothetical protein